MWKAASELGRCLWGPARKDECWRSCLTTISDGKKKIRIKTHCVSASAFSRAQKPIGLRGRKYVCLRKSIRMYQYLCGRAPRVEFNFQSTQTPSHTSICRYIYLSGKVLLNYA